MAGWAAILSFLARSVIMDEQAIRRAAYITLHRAICERIPPGRQRQAWVRWLARLNVPSLGKGSGICQQ